MDTLQKQLNILAGVLDGCPLFFPCDEFGLSDWCRNHCKDGQMEPDAECWLKYAEEMAK